MRSCTSEMKANILRARANERWGELSSGAIKPVIRRVLPIAEAEDAHALLNNRESRSDA